MCVSGANESKCIHEVGLSDLDLILEWLVWPKTEKQISEDTHYYELLLSWSDCIGPREQVGACLIHFYISLDTYSKVVPNLHFERTQNFQLFTKSYWQIHFCLLCELKKKKNIIIYSSSVLRIIIIKSGSVCVSEYTILPRARYSIVPFCMANNIEYNARLSSIPLPHVTYKEAHNYVHQW